MEIILKCGITGGRFGDILEAKDEKNKWSCGAVFEITDIRGYPINPILWTKILKNIDTEEKVKKYAEFWNIIDLKYAANEILKNFNTFNSESKNTLGKLCKCKTTAKNICTCPGIKLKVIQLGRLIEHGNKDKLLELIGKDVEWYEILRNMNGHTLVLRENFFEIRKKSEEKNGFFLDLTRHNVIFDKKYKIKDKNIIFDVDDNFHIIVPNCTELYTDFDDLIHNVFVKLDKEYKKEDIVKIREILNKLTLGQLKSAMQKIVRVSPKFIEIPDYENVINNNFIVNSDLFMASIIITMILSTGVFVPELQQFSRGAAACFKRLAIIIMEDGWINTNIDKLLGYALVHQKNTTWNPTKKIIIETCIIAIKCMKTKVVISKKEWNDNYNYPEIKLKRYKEFNANRMWRVSTYLLFENKSLKGDYRMCIGFMKNSYKRELELVSDLWSEKLEIMPLEHIVDGHNFRGIAHTLPEISENEQFSFKMTNLFVNLTGINWRRPKNEWYESQSKSIEEAFETSDKIRKMQKLTLISQIKKPNIIVKNSEINYEIDHNITISKISGAAREISVKIVRKKFYVCLGQKKLENEIVILQPSKSIKDLHKDITDDERQKAINIARTQEIILNSHIYKCIDKKVLSYDNEKEIWKIDNMSVNKFISKLESEKFPIIKFKKRMIKLYENIELGIVENINESLINLLSHYNNRSIMRLLELSKNWKKIEMPLTDIRGKISSENTEVYPEDSYVWKILMYICNICPAAIIPDIVPNFKIINSNLFEHIRNIIENILWSRNNCEENEKFKLSDNDPVPLMRHQIDAVSEMIESEKRNHFLFMGTGYGKTKTTVNYFRALRDKIPKYIIWTAPSETIESIKIEIEKSGGVAEIINKNDSIKPYIFNIIKHDNLRVILSNLLEIITESGFVVDECDECYNNTKRTSAALLLAHSCKYLIAQTATPLRNTNELQKGNFLSWLRLIIDFPIDKKNWIVGATAMISKQIDLGIEAIYKTIKLDFDESIREKTIKIIKNKNDGWWSELEKLTRSSTDIKLCKIAKKYAKKYDGCLLVANDKEHAEILFNMLGKKKSTLINSNDRDDKLIVIVTKNENRGYNWAIRLGAIVSGVYSGNSADRTQMIGRLLRTGQKRDKIHIIYVYMKNTILELLYDRHNNIDSINTSLETIAKKYSNNFI